MTVSKFHVETFFTSIQQSLENRIILTVGNVHYFLEPGWVLIYDKSRKSAGTCRSDKKITISTPYINSENTTMQNVIETLLHEFAHAIAGILNGHNLIWNSIARIIGSSGDIYCKTIFAPFKYKLICPMGCCHYRHQLVKRVYTNRQDGYAKCPKHRDYPVIVIKIDDGTTVRSYSKIEDLHMACQQFNRITNNR